MNEFIKKTEKYKSGNSGEQQKLKTEAFAEWTAYVYLNNSDNNKYGTLKKSLQSQYALRNDQYPRTISLTADVMTNHQWDDKYRETNKKRKENSGGGGSRSTGKGKEKDEKSLAQTNSRHKTGKEPDVGVLVEFRIPR